MRSVRSFPVRYLKKDVDKRQEQYSKASGLVQVAGSAKYLISPILAGFLLTISDIRLLLVLDIGTFFVTVTTTLAVRKGLPSKKTNQASSFVSEFKDGFRAVTGKKGVMTLVVMGSVVTPVSYTHLDVYKRQGTSS